MCRGVDGYLEGVIFPRAVVLQVIIHLLDAVPTVGQVSLMHKFYYPKSSPFYQAKLALFTLSPMGMRVVADGRINGYMMAY